MFRSLKKFPVLLSSISFVMLLVISPAHALAALSGRWSCLGSTVFGVTFTKGGPAFAETLTALINLNLSPTGGPPGTLIVSYLAEVCSFPLSAVAVTTNAAGQGTLKLTFNPNVGDVDKDPGYKCGSSIYGRTSTITQNYLISVFNAGKGFFFIGNDDFLSPNASDNSDFFSPSGQCVQQ